ncbi:MAG: hypothetical protein ACYCUI_07090 [Vulcanimicrobiaceae bacterium]
MSAEARAALVASPNTIFQADSQRADLLDENVTQTTLIALLGELVAAGHIIEFTAVKSDHHDDTALGQHCHFNGFCADCWPLASTSPGDYLAASHPRFTSFIADAAASTYRWQIGLAGSAWTGNAIAAAGVTVFHDDGADHVHLGANG